MITGSVGRPRQFDEARVLHSVMEAFWRSGYAGLSTRELGHAAGILPGSLHQAFGSKRELFLRALDSYIDVALNEIGKTLARPGSVVANLSDCLLFAAGEMPNSHREWGCLATNSAVEFGAIEADVTSRLSTLFMRKEDLISGAIVRAQQGGEVDASLDARTLARLLITLMDGLRATGKANPLVNFASVVELVLHLCNPDRR